LALRNVGSGPFVFDVFVFHFYDWFLLFVRVVRPDLSLKQ